VDHTITEFVFARKHVIFFYGNALTRGDGIKIFLKYIIISITAVTTHHHNSQVTRIAEKKSPENKIPQRTTPKKKFPTLGKKIPCRLYNINHNFIHKYDCCVARAV